MFLLFYTQMMRHLSCRWLVVCSGLILMSELSIKCWQWGEFKKKQRAQSITWRKWMCAWMQFRLQPNCYLQINNVSSPKLCVKLRRRRKKKKNRAGGNKCNNCKHISNKLTSAPQSLRGVSQKFIKSVFMQFISPYLRLASAESSLKQMHSVAASCCCWKTAQSAHPCLLPLPLRCCVSCWSGQVSVDSEDSFVKSWE